jgi:hypothetical protein
LSFPGLSFTSFAFTVSVDVAAISQYLLRVRNLVLRVRNLVLRVRNLVLRVRNLPSE